MTAVGSARGGGPRLLSEFIMNKPTATHREQRDRAVALFRSRGVDRALLADPLSVKWLLGFAPPVEIGPHLFAGGPPLIWYEQGHFSLIVVEDWVQDASGVESESDVTVIAHTGYTLTSPLEGPARIREKLRATIGRVDSGRLGIEASSVSASTAALVRGAASEGVDVVAVDDWLAPLRAVKNADELAALRANFRLADIGQAAAREGVRAGRSEIEVWTDVQTAIQSAAGGRLPLGCDAVAGHRVHNRGGWPTGELLAPQDSFLMDLCTNLGAYWSDSCGTYYAGEPTSLQRELHGVVLAALEHGISLVRPGLSARELDQSVRRFIVDAGYPDYPHHTGHGIGVSIHEAPRIVPYNTERLEAGMVILIEPGIYIPGTTSVRLEDAVLVTTDGAEVLTTHDKSIS